LDARGRRRFDFQLHIVNKKKNYGVFITSVYVFISKLMSMLFGDRRLLFFVFLQMDAYNVLFIITRLMLTYKSFMN
jgi:hypothetical protein